MSGWCRLYGYVIFRFPPLILLNILFLWASAISYLIFLPSSLFMYSTPISASVFPDFPSAFSNHIKLAHPPPHQSHISNFFFIFQDINFISCFTVSHPAPLGVDFLLNYISQLRVLIIILIRPTRCAGCNQSRYLNFNDLLWWPFNRIIQGTLDHFSPPTLLLGNSSVSLFLFGI